MSWKEIGRRVLDGEGLTRDEGRELLASHDDELLDVLQGAFVVRHHHHGRKVRVHVLRNARSGTCPEDCSFCSQSVKFDTGVDSYPIQSVDELVAGAEKAAEMGAVTYCMVTSTRRPSAGEVETICEATRQIKERWGLRVCASLGMLESGQAETLAGAGVDRYNHNLETSRDHFPNIVTTHKWEDRVATVRAARDAGMEACCGGIVGLGEEADDRLDLAFSLAELGVESIPLNFLDPRDGTPMEEQTRLSPQDALRSLALIRLANPQAIDVRVAGGREAVLGSMQPLALWAANSFFTDGYLTTPGQGPSADAVMIREAGFEPEILES